MTRARAKRALTASDDNFTIVRTRLAAGTASELDTERARDAVAAVEAWCAVGPRRARVERVEARDELPAGEQGFAVA